MEIQFYEKPGCVNNTRQKLMLTAEGHNVIAHSLLTETWTAESLRNFFGNMVVSDWFNNSAPRIKSGEVVPSNFDETSAIQAMLNDPLLIRRPLIAVAGHFVCGFDNELVKQLLNNADASHLKSCPNLATDKSCD